MAKSIAVSCSYTDRMIVILLIAVSFTSLLTCGVQIDVLQNLTGDFGISRHDITNGRAYHVWIITGTNIYGFHQENSSTADTVYEVAVNFSSVNPLLCGEQYFYIYKQSSEFSNSSTLLTATFTGTDLQSRSVLLQSSIVTVVYHYVGQDDDAIGFNATYSIRPLANTISMENLSERMCTGYYHHVAVHDKIRSNILLHGGVDHLGVLCNGITKINTDNMNKEYIHWLEGPSGRYLHSGIFTADALMIYGGRNTNETFGELWKFSTSNEQWLKLTGYAPLYGHSATLVGHYMIIVGGINSMAANNVILQYNITSDVWESVETYGAVKPASVIGHTAVYDSLSNALLIYGGLLLIDMKFVESDTLFSLNMHSMEWSLLHVTSMSSTINLIRIFSTSVLIDQTLYVFGGLVANSYDCYSSDMLLFVLNSTCGYIPVLRTEGMFMRFGSEAVALRNGTVLLSGGYHSRAYDDIVTFVPTHDVCTLLTTQRDCSALQWCQYCHFGTSDNIFCISSYRNDAIHLCNGAAVFLSPPCSTTTPCALSQTCGSCLSNDFQQQRSCHWCPCSEKCVNSSSMCLEDSCFLQEYPSLCYFSQCAVATCEECVRKGCIWTSQLEYIHGITVRVSRQPNQWRCFSSEIVYSIKRQLPVNFIFNVIYQLQQCPLPCSSFTSCQTCTNALSHLVGPVGCTWILETGMCLTHIEVLINCPTGSCGVAISDEQLCLEPCDSYSYCHSCLLTDHCIWCHQNGSNGEGFCIDPEEATECLKSNTALVNQECPAEDECINDHNNCFPDQQCNDVLDGFVCTCPNDYMARETACIPVCTGNCSNHGVCILPDVCDCDLGYIGENCSVQCKCNGHSDCVDDSIDGRAICIECLHNTQGEYCDTCKPSFVESEENSCISCLEFCHGNSELCIESNLISDKNCSLDLANVTKNTDGLHFNETICIQCQNNTTGKFCNECIPGYFYQETAESFHCIRCSCNGHGSTCNSTTGLNCDCHNNTITVCPPNEKCIDYQCTSCMEGYVGQPTNGSQCYKKLDHNIRYTEHLPPRQTSYYFIQPMYSNLNIQVFINIIGGSLDVFVSNSSQIFKITVNSTTWEHNIEGNNDLSGPPGTIISYYNINEKIKLEFSYKQYNLQNEKFYFVLLSKDSAMDFNIIFYQAALKLNWLSIIVLFLCFFVIIFLTTVMAVYVKRHWNVHRHQRLYRHITNKRLSRPFSRMYVLLNDMMFVNQNNMNITNMFCRATPSSAKSKQTVSLNAVSVQPTTDSNAFINSVLIQLPRSSSGHVNLTTGVFLNCSNLNNNGNRLQTKVTPL